MQAVSDANEVCLDVTTQKLRMCSCFITRMWNKIKSMKNDNITRLQSSSQTVTMCTSEKAKWIYHFHLHGQRVTKQENGTKVASLPPYSWSKGKPPTRQGAAVLLSLHFDPEDGGGMFLQNVGTFFFQITWCYNSENHTVHSQCCNKHKSGMSGKKKNGIC
jgi:hypothetical protein